MSNYYVTSKSAVLLPGRIIAIPGQEVDASIFEGKGGQQALQNLLNEGCLKPFQTIGLDPSGLSQGHGVRAGRNPDSLPPLPVETEDTKIQGVAKSYAKTERKLEEIERKQAEAAAAEEASKAKAKSWKDRKAEAKARQEQIAALAAGGPDENEIDVDAAKALGLLK